MSNGSIRCFATHDDQVVELELSRAAERVRDAARAPAADGEGLVWIDIVDPGDAEAAYLRDQLHMHPLAVEDCLRGRQRPKLDRYSDCFFLVFYVAALTASRRRMSLNELHLFLGGRFLITVHDEPVAEVHDVLDAWREAPARYNDSGSAAHALLDAVVDNYFPMTEHFSERLEALEEQIFKNAARDPMRRAIHLRHEMIILRRILAPERDVLSSLVRRDLPFVRPELVPYFQDVHDHILRVTEEIDAFRDLITGLLEVQTSTAANELNRTVQTLTGWSIILMSMALVAGIYGMNFDFMPELRLRWGYAWALGLMLLIGVFLLTIFRRRRWL